MNIDKLHALVGRLLSHTEELAGRPELPPGLAKDVQTATALLDKLASFLGVLAEGLPPDDLPEPSRSSHFL